MPANIAPPTEHNPGNREVQLVDQPCLKILAYGRHASANVNILFAGHCLGPVERILNSTRYEMENSAPVHDD